MRHETSSIASQSRSEEVRVVESGISSQPSFFRFWQLPNRVARVLETRLSGTLLRMIKSRKAHAARANAFASRISSATRHDHSTGQASTTSDCSIVALQHRNRVQVAAWNNRTTCQKHRHAACEWSSCSAHHVLHQGALTPASGSTEACFPVCF